MWLKKINDEIHNIEYKMSKNGEAKILGRFVDGYNKDTNTVYQFHGCFHHGCKKCYDLNDYNNVLKEKFFILREQTKRFIRLLKEKKYNVIEKWECDFINEEKISKKEIKKKKNEFASYIPLEPRDALYGGRTSPVCLYYEINEKEKIRYLDFTSLYPSVQKNNVFPIGHPEIYVKDECKMNVRKIFGLIKCKILPPQNLYFPVLPLKINGKLLFPLCKTCAEEQNIYKCNHKEEERILCGTWTSLEVNVAIQRGYITKEMIEVYHYKKKEKIFVDYVNTFLKIKQESSGVPLDCLDDLENIDTEKLEKYIIDYEQNEGIKLNKDEIKTNPGKRTVAKTLLNSLWGKLAQNDNNVIVKFIEEYSDLISLINDYSLEVTTVDFISENICRVTYKKKLSTIANKENRNVIIASFVTAYARLELFKILEKLNKRVLYFDTDSIIFICNEENYNDIKTGQYLGELTDELDNGEWIESFCSTGPKCYSYITNLKKNIIHVKGFSIKTKEEK